MAAALALGLVALPATASVEDGRRLFAGEVVLQARLAGHTDSLPGVAIRCSNCHSSGASKRPGTSGYAPPLTARSLIEPRARRGGPPSQFDAVALCKVLRSGIDPAGVMVDTAMPRYEISNSQCASLWAYLTSQP